MVSAIKLSYHQRLFLLLLAFAWSIIFCFMGYQYHREKQYKSDFLCAQLQLYNRHLLKATETQASYPLRVDTLEKPFDNLRISIMTLAGDVVYDNRLPLDSLDNHKDRPEVAAALKNGEGYHIGRHSQSDGKEYFYAATKGRGWVVRTAMPYSDTLRDLLEADWGFFFVMLSISLAMSIVAYFATRRLGKNIERLNRFAANAENGQPFDEKESFPNDELGAISRHIVQLYEQWQQTIRDRDEAHEAALREEQEKIRIKRQLTNNINHELKTPVASLQVCLETLLSGMPLAETKRQELIERCYIHNERLRRLLNDVSHLTRLEDGQLHIEKERIVINDLLHDMKEELEVVPTTERMELHLDLNEEIVIEGNLSLIASIFQNLTENALAYSGGKNIFISLLENTDTECRLRFEDDGRGVEDEQLPRLFERFYRVDKGRSRRMGGTGLGLAIVKHAVQFHGGSITAVHRPEGGLRFDFSLKK